MQAVILPGRDSALCHPLTLTRPRSMLRIANRTVLEHNLDQLDGIVDGVVIVVGREREMVAQLLGDEYGGLRLTYVEQGEGAGAGHGLLQAESFLRGRFVALCGDHLYSRCDLERSLAHECARLVHDGAGPGRSDVTDGPPGSREGSSEKAPVLLSGLADAGLYLVDEAIFPLIRDLQGSAPMECELADAVRELAESRDMVAVRAQHWFPHIYPWDLLESNAFLLQALNESAIRGEVETGATLKGIIGIGGGTTIRSGSYIEGPVIIGENCEIGPNCYIRPATSIGDDCKVGQAVEIKNSIIMAHSRVSHLSYVGDSIIGEGVNLGAGTIAANLRHDHNNVKSMIGGQLLDTGRRKLGAMIGDNVHTGIHTSIYPGRKIWPHRTTLPGEIVKYDIV